VPPAEAEAGHASVDRVEPAEVSVGDDSAGSPVITQKQIALLMATAKEARVDVPALRKIVKDVAGVDSRKSIPISQFDEVLQRIKNWGEYTGELVTERQEDPA
jgi:hypothetical protein